MLVGAYVGLIVASERSVALPVTLSLGAVIIAGMTFIARDFERRSGVACELADE